MKVKVSRKKHGPEVGSNSQPSDVIPYALDREATELDGTVHIEDCI